MKKVKLYTGTQRNQSINLWGELAIFDSEGVAEVTEEIAKKAASGIPADYSLEPTNRRTASVKNYTHVTDTNGVGKRAASVVEREHKAQLEAQKKEEAKAAKSDKKSKKKSSKSNPPNDGNPKDSDSEDGKSGDIWK